METTTNSVACCSNTSNLWIRSWWGGCGNSELSEQLYDVGYRHLTNIDISEMVMNHMNQKNAKLRPDLTFQKVDATQTPYEDGSYQATLDKGTLDTMASQE